MLANTWILTIHEFISDSFGKTPCIHYSMFSKALFIQTLLIPYHIRPHNTTQHHTLHHTTLHHITPHHTTPHYTTPHCTPPQYTTPHDTAPHHTAPHHTSPHHTTRHHTTHHNTHHTIIQNLRYRISLHHTGNMYLKTCTKFTFCIKFCVLHLNFWMQFKCDLLCQYFTNILKMVTTSSRG